MAPHQRRERRFVPLLDEAMQQLGVGQIAAALQQCSPAQTLNNAIKVAGGHGIPFFAANIQPLPIYSCLNPDFIRDFRLTAIF
jgi:hypothetical protein